MSPAIITGTIAALAAVGVIMRPFALPEALWAVGGAVLLLVFRALTPLDALAGVLKGTDVYLFLAGMMLLAEIAREAGLFDWLAAIATQRAGGSAARLFLLTYGVGVLVTTFLSNDATAVVLTPAVAAAVRAADVEQPLPYLLICAFIANAASFVLPISNPANLVIYGRHMPPLLQWLPRYLLPSLVSIVATYAALYWTQRRSLQQRLAAVVPVPVLTPAGSTAALGITATAIALMVCSASGVALGLPTAIAGAVTAAIVLLRARSRPWKALAGISWGVLPLVAGLFVLVEGLDKSGLMGRIGTLLQSTASGSPNLAAWTSGALVAAASNLLNNLPVGLIAGNAVHSAHAPDVVTRAVLIGVDLGPNLSMTGSLATILWLAALRREGHRISALQFLRLGVIVAPPALLAAIAAAVAFGQ